MSTTRLSQLQHINQASTARLASTFIARFSRNSTTSTSTSSPSSLPRCLLLRHHPHRPLLLRRHLSGRSRLPLSNPAELPSAIRGRFLPEFSQLYGKYLASRPDEVTEILRDIEKGNTEAAGPARKKQHYGCLSAKEAEAAGVTWHDVSLRRAPGKLTDYRPPGIGGKGNKGNIGRRVGKRGRAYDAYDQEDDMKLRVYTPPNMSRDAPIVVYFPSGGFVFGSVELEHGLAAHLSVLTGSMVVSVGYRTAPAHCFPIPVHDAVAAVDWVRTNLAGWEWDFDLMEYVPINSDNSDLGGQVRRKIALLGNGAGGALATVIGVTEGMQRGIDAIGVWCPITDWSFDPVPGLPDSKYSTLPKSPGKLAQRLKEEYDEERPLDVLPLELKKQLGLAGNDSLLESYDDIADSPFLSTATMELFRDAYMPDSSDWTDPFASPLYFFKTPGHTAGEVNEDPNIIAEYMPELLGLDEDGKPIYLHKPTSRIKPKSLQPKKRIHRMTLGYPRLEHMPLTVPPIRLTLAGSDVLYRQGLEFGNAVRASCYSKLAHVKAEEVEAYEYSVLLEDKYRGGLFDPLRPEDYDERVEDDKIYKPEAEKWVDINVVSGVPNCFVSCAGESEAGYQELERMSNWLKGVFQGSHGVNDKILGRKWYNLRRADRELLRNVERGWNKGRVSKKRP